MVEYSSDPQKFVMNVFHIYGPQKVEIEQRGNITHATVTVDPKLKGRAIGKAGKNLRIARDIVNTPLPWVSGSIMFSGGSS